LRMKRLGGVGNVMNIKLYNKVWSNNNNNSNASQVTHTLRKIKIPLPWEGFIQRMKRLEGVDNVMNIKLYNKVWSNNNNNSNTSQVTHLHRFDVYLYTVIWIIINYPLLFNHLIIYNSRYVFHIGKGTIVFLQNYTTDLYGSETCSTYTTIPTVLTSL
jgi:hypothetical protein